MARSTRGAVKLVAETDSAVSEAHVAESPLFGVAMLKIAMELKKPNSKGLDEILTGVLRKMNVSEAAFRAYLDKNGGLLRTIAQKREY